MKDVFKQIYLLRRNWAHIVLWAGVGALFFPVFEQLYSTRWSSLHYEHAYFILPISLYMIWRKKKELLDIYSRREPGFSSLCAFLFAAGIWMYVFGWKWGYMFVCAAAFIPATAALTGFVYGPRVLKRVWFSFFYLIFMIPPPTAVLDSITLPMRYVSASIAYKMLSMAGYATVKKGLIINIHDFPIMVGTACSGFRSFITLAALGVLYIYLFARKERVLYKATLLGLIPVLAILGNSLRICVVGLLGYYFGSEAAESFLHSFSGIIVFVFMILGLFAAEVILGKV
ncbi:MAG: exosortase/archaeosortase family protein, partial [Candidatus Omnitrophica bacterium]|nr:exosortase/archaeosortase family protein [Candidatus Omnitrophota bacterium]